MTWFDGSLLFFLAITTGLAFYFWRERDQMSRKLIEAEGRLQVFQEKDRLGDAFKGLASQALEASMSQFLGLAQQSFQSAQQLNQSQIESSQQSLNALLTPISGTLKAYQEQLQKLEVDRQIAFQSIDSELKKVADVQTHLAKTTLALKDALKKPHVRGRWGEVQLRNCIELAGMSEYADVSFQDATSEADGTRHIPDMVVRMPGGRRVVVDAKTPIDAFLSSLEATTDEQRAAEMLRHGKHLKEHVKRLSTRAYTEVIKESADFTVLFLPNESFLYAALEVEPDVVEFALQKKVLIATPPTLIGLLKVIRYGWNEQRMAENAQAISEMGQELHKRLCDFVEGYVSVGKALDKAKDEYEKGRARLESRVLVQARRFEALGAKSNKSLIDAPAESPEA